MMRTYYDDHWNPYFAMHRQRRLYKNLNCKWCTFLQPSCVTISLYVLCLLTFVIFLQSCTSTRSWSSGKTRKAPPPPTTAPVPQQPPDQLCAQVRGEYCSLLFLPTIPSSAFRTLWGHFELKLQSSRALDLTFMCFASGTSEKQGHRQVCPR